MIEGQIGMDDENELSSKSAWHIWLGRTCPGWHVLVACSPSVARAIVVIVIFALIAVGPATAQNDLSTKRQTWVLDHGKRKLSVFGTGLFEKVGNENTTNNGDPNDGGKIDAGVEYYSPGFRSLVDIKIKSTSATAISDPVAIGNAILTPTEIPDFYGVGNFNLGISLSPRVMLSCHGQIEITVQKWEIANGNMSETPIIGFGLLAADFEWNVPVFTSDVFRLKTTLGYTGRQLQLSTQGLQKLGSVIGSTYPTYNGVDWYVEMGVNQLSVYFHYIGVSRHDGEPDDIPGLTGGKGLFGVRIAESIDASRE